MTAAERLQAEKERLLTTTGFYVPPYRMANLMKAAAKIMDIIIKAAAVADYRVECQSPVKIKKNDENMTLKLVKNPDILKNLGRCKTHQILVGFAAETNDLLAYAKKKLQ